jgi:hypothetical protein
MAYIFNGTNRTITLSSGTIILDLVDLHSRWKDWVRGDNAGFEIAFLTVGGDIPAIPLYLFLLNGWRIVPQSSNHTLTVTNGILEVEGGGDPFVDPVGSYKIRINRQSPGIAIGYSNNGTSDAASIASAVWNHNSAINAINKLSEIWGRLGLDSSSPLITGNTSITFGDIIMALSETASTVTVTRQ